MFNFRVVLLVAVTAAGSGGCGPRPEAQPKPASHAPASDSPSTDSQPGGTPSSASPPVVTVSVGKEPAFVNLIPNESPPTPKFPAVAKKPGVLRGYVLDPAGKPLSGASVGVRATLLGGRYSGASAESDEKGYYEVTVPQGVAEVYAAGVAVDYAGGRAALPLHPADGKLSSFASADGAVVNFVLWTSGVADRDRLSENPRLSSNFYGGALYIGHFTSDSCFGLFDAAGVGA